jgi:hypothetical protein
MRSRARLISFLLVSLLAAGRAAAQTGGGEEPAEPAFSLSSNEVYTTRDSPAFNLTFRHLTQLDFRVYRVRDPFAFFAGLRDPHELGSLERPVAQERSWIERIADWKAERRREIRRFFRDQVSSDYRLARRTARDKQEIKQRIVLNKASFAQVPLLNPDQLVTAWREILPDYRDSEYRRVPLEVNQEGIYLVEAVSGLLRAYTIVVVSDIGIVTKLSPGQLLMFAADRFSGEPKSGCDAQVMASQKTLGGGRTAPDGVLTVSLPEDKPEDIVGIVRCGEQMAVASPGSWYASEPQRELVGYIYTDKPIYRPGHQVHIKAVLRWRAQDALMPFDRPDAEISVADANEKVVFRESLKTDAFGALAASFRVPATAALGYYSIRVATGESQAGGGFEVQEYRRPEFEVIVAPKSRFVVQGDTAVASVQARYYFGQPVANARVRYVVNMQGYYSPLRWDDGADTEEGGGFFYGGDQRVEGELRLDAQGRGEIQVPLEADENGHDYSARIEAQVTDASSREVSGSTVVHATYGPFLISSQLSGYIFRPGAAIPVSLRTIDYVGTARAGVPLTVTLERLTYPDGRYSEPTATAVTSTTVTTADDGTATARLTAPQEPGSYRVRTTTPYQDRELKDDAWVWVPGRAQAQELTDEEQYLELLADKRTYTPGDTARIVIRGEPVSGPVLITKEGQHVTWHTVARPNTGEALDVPIESGDIGDIYVSVAFMREGRLFRAERRLVVPAADRALQITLTADKATAKPQEPGVFTVSIKDTAGAPAQAQVSLGVIDEAVYAVRPDDTPDPVRHFYRREYSRVGTEFSRDYYFTGFSGSDRLQLASRRRRPFTLADFKGDKQVQPQVRKDFPDAIYWIADLVTDAAGQARVSIKYPDALTTWRLTARAVTRDTKAGAAVVRTTTTKDLIVRVITPRFLTEGDQVVLPTIAHNYLPDAKDVTVTFAAKGLEPDAAGGAPTPTSGSIASGGERRNDWRFKATAVGAATVTAAARTDADSDAVELPVPVLPYGLRREPGVSGTLLAAGEATADVAIPAASNPAARLVSVALAPSMGGALLGALDYLTEFPYGCTEQTLSSFLPNVVVTRTLTQLKLVPTERLSLLDRQVAEGLKRLYDFQHEDGGWGWWKTDANHPFMTAYALFGLSEAKRAGYKVEDYRLMNGARALAAMYADYPRAEPDLKAYMAYALRRASTDAEVRYRADGQDEARTYSHEQARNELWNARSRMSAYGRALLLQLLDEVKDGRGNELAAALAGEVKNEGQLSWWSLERDPLLEDFADTSVEVTAIAIQALAQRDPGNAVLDRAVRWLMLNRNGGYWVSTKQTAMALYGLTSLMQARNETAQPFSVDVYVNGTKTATHAFSAAALTAPDPVVVSAPGREGANAIRLVKSGGGSLYWSATATYYDTAGAQARGGDHQLAITRKYARLSPVKVKDRIVYREEAFDGRMNPGDVLSVRITIAGSKDWRYLIVEDPLPAGVEAVQDTTAYPMERADRWRWWWGSQVEYRDNRTVFFQERFPDGRAEFVYLVKAISSGEFRAVPAQVSPMYVPNVTASSEPQTVVVAVPAEGSR